MEKLKNQRNNVLLKSGRMDKVIRAHLRIYNSRITA